jgi:hypothetical protein
MISEHKILIKLKNELKPFSNRSIFFDLWSNLQIIWQSED